MNKKAQDQQQLEEEARQQEEMARIAAAKENNQEIYSDCHEEYIPNEGEIQKPNLGEPSESNIFSLIFFSAF